MNGGGEGGGGSVQYAEVPSVAVITTTGSKAKLAVVAAAAPEYVNSAELLAYPGGSSISFSGCGVGGAGDGGGVETGTGVLRREGSNRGRPL